MRKPNKNKMASVNSRFASVSESKILKIQEDAVPENTKKATKFGMKIFRGKRRLDILQTRPRLFKRGITLVQRINHYPEDNINPIAPSWLFEAWIVLSSHSPADNDD